MISPPVKINAVIQMPVNLHKKKNMLIKINPTTTKTKRSLLFSVSSDALRVLSGLIFLIDIRGSNANNVVIISPINIPSKMARQDKTVLTSNGRKSVNNWGIANCTAEPIMAPMITPINPRVIICRKYMVKACFPSIPRHRKIAMLGILDFT